MRRDRSFVSGLAAGALFAVIVGVFIVPFLGVVDMSATGEPGLVDWWGHTSRESSLYRQASDVELPASADAMQGLREYAKHCLHCHGAPAIAPAEWARRMQPVPPELWRIETQGKQHAEIFRIVERGARMTGMPPFGPDHDDSTIWNLVATVRALDDLDPEQWKLLQSPEGLQRGERLAGTFRREGDG